MRYALLVLLGAGMITAAPVSAQVTHRTAEQIKADYDVHRGDFDYLLGDWEFTAVSREYGRFRGLWSAVRLPDGQLLDEYCAEGEALGRSLCRGGSVGAVA